MKFIGRKKELQILNNAVHSDRQEALLIYGRRRIGKTQLIRKCLSDVSCKQVYFQCREVTETVNVRFLSEEIAASFDMPGVKFDSLDKTLQFLFEAARKEPVVLVLDEYPFLRKQTPGCDSIIQAYLDQYKNTESRMKLIISGSYMDIMKSLIEYEAPLYGRFSNVLKLKPMNYLEASEFYPSFSKEDKVLLYSVFGGIPYYNSLIQTDRSAIQNIFDLVLNENAPLKEEVPSFLKSEISKAENANSVFDAIAGGKTKFKDILDESGLGSDAALNNLLLKLIGMEIIEKEYPLNHPQDKKKANYRITDSLALFYYRYLFRNLSKIETMGAKAFFTRYIKEDFESLYIPKSFEKICRQFLIEENRSGRIQPVLEEIGKYYYDDPKNHRNGEFDIVARDENGWIFYEAKYKKRPVDDTQILEEAEQVKNSPLPAYQFGFFSRSGFVLHNKYPYLFFTLDDLFPENR